MDGVHVGPELCFRAAHAQLVVCNAEIFSGGDRSRGRRFRNVQPLHHDVIGQPVFFARIDGFWLRRKFRLWRFLHNRLEQAGVSLVPAQRFLKLFPVHGLMAPGIGAGVNADLGIAHIPQGAGHHTVSKVQDHGIPQCVRGLSLQKDGFLSGRFLEKAVSLLQIHGPENGRDLLPARPQLRAEFILDAHFQPGGRSKIIRFLTTQERHGLGGSGIGLRQLLCDAGIPFAGGKPDGEDFLVPLAQQPALAGEDILQVGIG